MTLKFILILGSWLFIPIFLQANSHHPQEFLQTIQGAKDQGRQIVAHFCSSCHAAKPMIQLGAPRINNKKDWSPRIKKGLATLLANTENGFNAMPPRGGCFECSDQQLHLAILAMLPQALKTKELDHK